MPPQEFAHWKQKTLLGVSLKVIAPTGQYDGTKLINWVINRWAFKPELGYSRRLGNWLLVGYGGAWLYTTNSTAFAGPAPGPKTQEPIGSLEATLATTSYNAPGSRLMAISGGAASRASAVTKFATKQVGSRLGGTGSLPLSHHRSVKISYSNGTYVRFGGNYQNVPVAWQYSWLGRPN